MLIKKSPAEKLADVFVYAFFTLLALLCVYPFYYILINTISDNTLVEHGRVFLLPAGVHFDNYRQIFKLPGILHAAMVSVSRTVIGTLLTVAVSSWVGYAMSKDEFWLRKFWYRFAVITMYFNAGLIPYFMLIRSVGLLNTFWVYVIPGAVAPFNMILIKTYIESVPASLEESAEIDGAGYLTRYLNIILPLTKPILATVAIFTAVGHWNAFMDTIIYANRPNLYTLQFILNRFLNELQALRDIIRRSPDMADVALGRMLTPAAIRHTVTAVVVLPVLLVYPFFQRFFVKGLMIGAVKG